MVIEIDSREQLPLVFKCETIRSCLKCGDYGAIFSENYQHNVVFERKSIGDLFGTLSQGYSRFKREIERSKENNITLVIIVEATREKILEGYKHSKRNGSSILIQLDTINKKYGIDAVFCKNRKEAAQFILDAFTAHEIKYLEGLNA